VSVTTSAFAWPRRRLRLALAPLLLLWASMPLFGAATTEYQVKAVFLFNFSQFVTWPMQAFANSDSPFVIGVLGRDPFGPELEAAVRGERAEGRPIVIRKFRTAAEVADCQILFIDRAEIPASADSIRLFQSRNILTVSDAPDAARRGAVIEFAADSNRIRLRINVAEAHARGLTISSKLLRPALVVGDGGS